jgi:hypothetical protein
MDLWEIGWECRVHFSGSGYGPVAGCCEHGGEHAKDLLESSVKTRLDACTCDFLKSFLSIFSFSQLQHARAL